jgi:hypothetical protein
MATTRAAARRVRQQVVDRRLVHAFVVGVHADRAPEVVVRQRPGRAPANSSSVVQMHSARSTPARHVGADVVDARRQFRKAQVAV